MSGTCSKRLYFPFYTTDELWPAAMAARNAILTICYSRENKSHTDPRFKEVEAIVVMYRFGMRIKLIEIF
jgi:hypothetical protein